MSDCPAHLQGHRRRKTGCGSAPTDRRVSLDCRHPAAPRRRARRRRVASRRLAGAPGPPGRAVHRALLGRCLAEAERGLLDFVTIEDSLGLQSLARRTGRRTDQVRGRLDAVLIAARVAPLTRHIGLIPTVVVTHTEPFHISKAIATLDYVSAGRAGVRVQVSARPHEAAQFGRRNFPRHLRRPRRPAVRQLVAGLFGEAADYVEVVRRLWDSWEDDAEIRDGATGRFIDRDKLHYIDFVGEYFSVKGPSITPRPPQGQPIVAALAHGASPYRLVARPPTSVRHPARRRAGPGDRGRDPRRAGGRRAAETVHVFADLVVFLDDAAAAADRKARLDELAG